MRCGAEMAEVTKDECVGDSKSYLPNVDLMTGWGPLKH